MSSGLYRYRSIVTSATRILDGFPLGERLGPTDQELLDVMSIVDTSTKCRGGAEVVDTNQQSLATSSTCDISATGGTTEDIQVELLTLRVLEEWSLGSMSTLHLRTIRLLSSWWPY